MLGFISRFLFTSTAIAPVAIVYAYALSISGEKRAALILLLAAIVLTLTALIYISLIRAKLSRKKVKFTYAETADQENIAFLLLYISPLFTSPADSLNYSIAIPVVILFLIVVMSGNNYHFNPLLNIFKWHFYKVATPDNVARVLITRRSIRNVVDTIEVVSLSDYVIMEVKER
ncbi:hypothetical protein [Parasphingopyxis marina]|uniref:Uncharacterized protein n=1 Tax=Parasphingopyxis marina TaxID=2761622 RepID=A0A842HW51_9SPHN|nr:hypothetical protein [Parasphingopyxis marina]MBC2776499.1 hypothetical protein [Parasphingopyxis marina]